MKRKAKEREQQAEATKALERWSGEFRFAGGRMPLDPTEGLRWMIESAALNVAILEQQVQKLRQGSGKKPPLGEYEPGLWSFIPEVGAMPHMWVKMYDAERDRLAKLCAECIKLGLDERMIRIAEQQGQAILEMIQAFAAAAGVTQEQQEKGNAAVLEFMSKRRLTG